MRSIALAGGGLIASTAGIGGGVKLVQEFKNIASFFFPPP